MTHNPTNSTPADDQADAHQGGMSSVTFGRLYLLIGGLFGAVAFARMEQYLIGVIVFFSVGIAPILLHALFGKKLAARPQLNRAAGFLDGAVKLIAGLLFGLIEILGGRLASLLLVIGITAAVVFFGINGLLGLAGTEF